MIAIPTMTPSEVAATPAATSRNMTLHRPTDWARFRSMRRRWDLQSPTVQGGSGSVRGGWRGLAQARSFWPTRHGARGPVPLPSAAPIANAHGLTLVYQCHSWQSGVATIPLAIAGSRLND